MEMKKSCKAIEKMQKLVKKMQFGKEKHNLKKLQFGTGNSSMMTCPESVSRALGLIVTKK